MKRRFAFVLLSIIALFSVMPLWGVTQAQAQNPKKPAPGESVDMSEIFKDRLNETNNGDFWLGPNSGKITTIDSFKTTAKLSAQLALDEKYSPAEDTNNDGVFNTGDYLGAWKAIITDEQTQLGIPTDKEYGIFIQIFEVKPGETLGGEGDGDLNKIITQGGPYYSTDKIKIPGTNIAGVFNREEFRSFAGKMYNVGVFFWALSPKNNFFDKKTVSTNIILTDLKPDTKYYYRLVLSEEESILNGGDDQATTEITEQTSFTTSSTKTDPSPEELQAISGASNGSSAEGNKSALIFGDKVECALSDPTTYFAGCLAMGYYNSIYFVSGWAVRGAAGLMDIFMAYSLGSFIYKNSFIDTGWTVVRDVCNILFIFILLWTAFKMVINDNHFKAQEVIVNIIVIGLLINFSLFFSKVIIDMGNISARVFYNQIRITGSAQNDQDEVAKAIKTGDLQPKAISEALANGLDITAIGEKGFTALAKQNNGFIPIGTVWLLLLLGTVINVAAAWIFIKVSFAFLGRILSLWMGMIFSPFAFTSRIIGGGNGGPLAIKRLGWADWLQGMLEASFYPALYLFFVFLIILLINDKFLASMIDDTTLSPTPYLIVTLFKLLFILGLLKVSASFSEKMSGMFGGELTAMAGKAAAFVGGAAIGVAAGGAAFLGRNSIGRVAGMVGTEERIAGLQEKAAKGGAGGWFARQSLKTIQGAQKASFDVRQTGAANKISAATGMNMDALGRVPGLGFLSTTGSAGGLEGARERKIAKMQARAESLGENKQKKKEIEDLIEGKKKSIEEKEEEVAQTRAALAEDKVSGGANKVTLTKALNQKEKELRNLQKTEKGTWTAEDAGAPGGPGGFPPAKPARKKADGSNVTLADVGKKREVPKEELGLNDLEKALKNNSKALAREYMSNQIRRTSPNVIGADKLDAFGNIKEFGHASVGVISRMDTLTRVLRNMAAGATRGGAVGALLTGFNPLGAGIGAIVGAVRGASDSIQYSAGLSGKLAEYAKRNTDEALHVADHATTPSDGKGGHAHGPKYKSTYKGPSMNIFSGLFGGGGDHGGGHDDHGGGGHH